MFGAKTAAKTWKLVLVSSAIAGALTSCGGDPSTGDATSTPVDSTPVVTIPSTPTEATPSAAAEPVTEAPVAAAPNGVAPVPPLPKECSNPTNQTMMNRCAQAEYAQVDAELNQRYQAVKGTLSADKQAVFVTAGQAWIAFRDADCEFVQAQFAGGSIQAMIHFGCLTQLTQDRIDELAAIPASQSYGAADQQLNQVYQDIQTVLSSPEQEQLTTAQLAWLEYRDLHCAVTGNTDQCLALLTEFRTQQLQNQLDARSL